MALRKGSVRRGFLRSTLLPCRVEIQSDPDAQNRHWFAVFWEADGERRSQSFSARLSDHVLVTAAHMRAEMGRRAGCVALRRSRKARVLVGLYRAAEAGLDVGGGAWVTVCERHDTLVTHETRAVAESWLADPTSWCEDCQKANPDV